MRHESPARFFVTGKPHQITDELHLRSLLGFERIKGAYLLELCLPFAVKDWPNMEEASVQNSGRVNVYTSSDTDVVLYMGRSEKMTSKQAAF